MLNATPKRPRGRPATGVDPQVAVRFPPPTLTRIDTFAASHSLDRSKGLRALVEVGLARMESGDPLTETERKAIANAMPGAYGGWDD